MYVRNGDTINTLDELPDQAKQNASVVRAARENMKRQHDKEIQKILNDMKALKRKMSSDAFTKDIQKRLSAIKRATSKKTKKRVRFQM